MATSDIALQIHSHCFACCLRRISPESIIFCRGSLRFGVLLVECQSPQFSYWYMFCGSWSGLKLRWIWISLREVSTKKILSRIGFALGQSEFIMGHFGDELTIHRESSSNLSSILKYQRNTLGCPKRASSRARCGISHRYKGRRCRIGARHDGIENEIS